MKKVVFVAALMLLSGWGLKAQQVPVFDSTQNFQGANNVMAYKGETVWVMPKMKALQPYGYKDFVKAETTIEEAAKNFSGKYRFGTATATSNTCTEYSELAGKAFVVDAIEVMPASASVKYDRYLFSLTGEDGTKCKFIYDPEVKANYPFLAKPYKDYLTRKYVTGKSYIVQINMLPKFEALKDQKLVVTDAAKTIWVPQEVSMLPEGQQLAILLTCKEKSIYMTTERLDKSYEMAEWKALSKQYGKSNMKLAANHNVRITLPEPVLVRSWGEPKEKHLMEDGVTTQYVYDQVNIYIKNGEISDIRYPNYGK